jgi:hypothetical protein
MDEAIADLIDGDLHAIGILHAIEPVNMRIVDLRGHAISSEDSMLNLKAYSLNLDGYLVHLNQLSNEHSDR